MIGLNSLKEDDFQPLSKDVMQSLLDRINGMPPPNVVNIDSKRYAQTIIDYHKQINQHWQNYCLFCDERERLQIDHKHDCIVLDAERVLKELEQ